jgi:hypothetical protein
MPTPAMKSADDKCLACDGLGSVSPDRYGYYAINCDACRGTGERDPYGYDNDLEVELLGPPTWQESLGSLFWVIGMYEVGLRRAASCDHDALKRDPVKWAALRPVGVQESGSGDEPDVELRDCPCGSTLGVELTANRSAS